MMAQRRDAAELVISFVDQDGGVRSAFENRLDSFDVHRCARGVVRIRDQDRRACRLNGFEQFFERKGQRARRGSRFRERAAPATSA